MRNIPDRFNLRLLRLPLQNHLKRNGITLFVICLLTASCATPPGPASTGSIETGSSGNIKGRAGSNEIEKRIRDEYAQWKGTKHRLGGTDQSGIDCSGFVREVYKTLFNMDLPRTTKEQVNEGSPINRKDLQAGDLVFFKPPTYPRHVGIFLSENEFVHASKSKGVIISRIDPYYWGKYYWTARRVLSSAHP
jgi:cell wall-associated NlpC family hydrolase